jgi:SAM-dependent methyltransferase
MTYEDGYYARHYRDRPWRRRGDRPTFYRSVQRQLRSLAVGNRLLDVGCGEGQFLRRASRTFAAHGVDLSSEGVAAARAATPQAVIEIGSAMNLPFGNESFDVVTCFDVLEHLDDPRASLAEMRRVLASAGVLVVSTPNPASLGHRRKGSRSFIYRDSTHVSVKPISWWRDALRDTGFAVVDDGTDTLWDPPYVSYVPQRLQWAFCMALSHAMWLARASYPWTYGENYVAFCRATGH